MPDQLRIQLNDLQFFGYHGLYAAEKRVGNQFIVNVYVDYYNQETIIDALNQTVDYVAIYALIQDAMKIPTPLLETIACSIATKILNEFKLAMEVYVCITKKSLPIDFFEGNASVAITKKREGEGN